MFVTIDTSAADVAVVQVNEGLAKGYYDALMHLKNSFSSVRRCDAGGAGQVS